MLDNPKKALVSVRDVKMHFPIHTGVLRRKTGAVKAVDGITFDIMEGETLGLVGESGCGKSTAGRAVLRLYDITSGEITMDGIEIGSTPQSQLREMRPMMQMVFQDPYGSLDPRQKVLAIVTEPIQTLVKPADGRSEMRDRAAQAMSEVGLRTADLDKYPHEFSGGQRQRIAIARALITRPSLIVADEPLSALDVSVQAQVLNLMMDLQDKHNLSYLLVSHDLAVVNLMCDEVLVLQDGCMVEYGSTEELFKYPQHPCTKSLLAAIPGIDSQAI